MVDTEFSLSGLFVADDPSNITLDGWYNITNLHNRPPSSSPHKKSTSDQVMIKPGLLFPKNDLMLLESETDDFDAQIACKPPKQVLSAILVGHFERPSNHRLGETCRTLKYLPLCPALALPKSKEVMLTVLSEAIEDSSIEEEPLHTIPSLTWPANKLPIEIFHSITKLLTKSEAKTLRLVNKEFEKKTSPSVFHTSTVAFKAEIYDMIGADGKPYPSHGPLVLRGYGPHIQRFGMSFEVTELNLANAPSKKDLESVDSYFGKYDWPYAEYLRFTSIAGLESIADDGDRMKDAFSRLTDVWELGLSMDSGLGWFNGPDRSCRTRVVEQPIPIFDQTGIPHSSESVKQFWKAIQRAHAIVSPQYPLKECSLVYRQLKWSAEELEGLKGTQYENMLKWPSIETARASPANEELNIVAEKSLGVIYTTPTLESVSPIRSRNLKLRQLELLVEMEWAQRAFLESYMSAIIGNPQNFHGVKILTIAKISGCFLSVISRKQFWAALPSLEELTLHIKPDWQYKGRADDGNVKSFGRVPSDIVDILHHDALYQLIATNETIKKLSLGWVSGGEHAEGITSRNLHLLPAPITPKAMSMASGLDGLGFQSIVFENLEHLVLVNCWITPNVLLHLIDKHKDKALQLLTLNSVSLTANSQITSQTLQSVHHRPQGLHWTEGHRHYSWPDLLNTISPGPTFAQYVSSNSTEPPPIRPESSLHSIQLNSCGYAKITVDAMCPFDQTCIKEDSLMRVGNILPRESLRVITLSRMIEKDYDPFCATVIPKMPATELAALNFAWGMREGWEDKFAAEGPEYDYQPSGGTGRFTGMIEKGMALIGTNDLTTDHLEPLASLFES